MSGSPCDPASFCPGLDFFVWLVFKAVRMLGMNECMCVSRLPMIQTHSTCLDTFLLLGGCGPFSLGKSCRKVSPVHSL